MKAFPLELGTGAGSQKNWNDGATGQTKKFDDIFSCVGTMHQRVRQTDGQTDRRTPGDSKDRTWYSVAQ